MIPLDLRNDYPTSRRHFALLRLCIAVATTASVQVKRAWMYILRRNKIRLS